MPVTVEREFKPNYFNPNDFTYFDPDAGAVVSHDGLRMLLAGDVMILSLQQALEGFADDASAEILYEIGFDWGQRHFANTDRFIFENYGFHPNVPDSPLSGYAFLCDRGTAASGWGRFFLIEENGLVYVHLHNSCYAMTVGRIGRPACHLYAGLFAGIFSAASETELACIEVMCYSMGADFCRFLLGSREQIDAAAFWLESGMTYESLSEAMK